MKKLLIASAAAGSLLFCSCGDKNENAPKTVEFKEMSAEQTIKTLHSEIAEGRISSVWSAMPASYQKDVTGIVHTFGSKVDKEVYDEGFKTVQSITSLLKNQKTIILELVDKHSKSPEEKKKLEELKANYDGITAFFDAVANSDVKSAESLKSLDLLKFTQSLDPHCAALIKTVQQMDGNPQSLEEFKNVSLEKITETADAAEYKLTYPNQKTENAKVAKVEGKWVPAEMAKGWGDMVKEANTSLGKMQNLDEKQKQSAITLMKSVQTLAKQLEEAKDLAAFEQTAQQGVGGLMGQAMGLQRSL